jgi:hypothetical protein
MRSPLSKIPLPLALALLAAIAVPSAAAGETVAPLPSSDYGVRASCGPPPPGHAACQALQLVPLTTAARAHTHPMVSAHRQTLGPTLSPAEQGFGLRPVDLHAAYSLPTAAPSAQTVALVDAYNDPQAEADLKVYSEEFALPSCTSEGECFRKVNQNGSAIASSMPFPKTAKELTEAQKSASQSQKELAAEAIGWGAEISLDVQTVHATCQSCKILLVEANSTSFTDLETAEATAAALGATEISNSFGGPDPGISPSADSTSKFNRPGLVITASAGDDGFRNWISANALEEELTEKEREEFAGELAALRSANYPASSPRVVAVGGTHLRVAAGTWTESVWNGKGAGGGGCSTALEAASWQRQASDWQSVGCGDNRAVADVAADADPFTGIALTDSDSPGAECPTKFGGHNWCQYGGTSLASPLIASVFALAGGSHGVSYPAQTLYENLRNAPRTLRDVTLGSNGECGAGYDAEGVSRCEPTAAAAASCSSTLACLAAPGYDGPTGVGTPNGVLGFVPGQHEAQPEAAPATSGRTTTSPAPPAAPVVTPPPPAIRLTALALTAPALSALRSHHATPRSIVFAFVINVPAKVRITLLRRVHSHGRTRWVAAGRAATIAAAAGRNVKRLSGSSRLPKGVYRLTLTPASGASRSITFTIR